MLLGMRPLLFLSLCLPVFARDSAYTAFDLSQTTLVAANAIDIGSSIGKYETNPVLGRGVFGFRQTVVKSAITAGLVIAERPLARRNKAVRLGFTVANFVVSGVLVGTACQNMQVR